MKKFIVSYDISDRYSVEIYANNEQEALRKFRDGDFECEEQLVSLDGEVSNIRAKLSE